MNYQGGDLLTLITLGDLREAEGSLKTRKTNALRYISVPPKLCNLSCDVHPYTNECRSYTASIKPKLKFADDIAILRLVNNKNEILYRSEVSEFIQ